MLLNSNWLEEASVHDSLSCLLTLAHLECSRITNKTLQRELESLLESRDYRGLLEYSLDYTAGYNVSDVIAARQCLGYFQKFEPLGDLLKVDRTAEAYKKFLATEQRCKATNEFFRAWQAGDICFPPLLDERLHAAKWKIAKVLGPVPPFASLEFRLGPGATTTVKRRESVPSYKLYGTLGVATNSIPYLPLLFELFPKLYEENGVHAVEDGEDVWRVEIVESMAELEFVPKDALTNRSILKVPTLTSFCQMGIGGYMTKRLRANGIDISNQTLNQRLAAYGSMSGALATLDLSSASDTVSRELVRFLLPDDWYSFLSCFAEKQAYFRGDKASSLDAAVIELEKFSAMGNGFTFPLETLIFYALVWAASPHHERGYISAYGDDLVCSSERAPHVCELLEACGFSVNTKKSFWTGPFRESCGADFYFGVNVRPYRQKRNLSGESAFVLHNFHVRRYDEESSRFVSSIIPDSLKLYGPDGYGDGHLLDQIGTLKPCRRERGWSGYTFETYSRVGRKSTRLLPGDWIALLYTLYTRSSSGKKEAGVEIRPLPIASHNRLIKLFPGGSETVYKRTKIYTLGV